MSVADVSSSSAGLPETPAPVRRGYPFGDNMPTDADTQNDAARAEAWAAECDRLILEDPDNE